MSSHFYKSILQLGTGLFFFLNVIRLTSLLSAEETTAFSFEAKKIAVIEACYFEFVLGAGLAEWGQHIFCANILQEKILSLQNGEIPFYPDLNVWGKNVSNAFLATKITFINEFANLFDATGADIDTVAYGLGLDPRIGTAFLKPGSGFYGGSCLPKDTSSYLHQAKELEVDLKVVQATIDANDAQIVWMITKLRQLLGKILLSNSSRSPKK